MSVHTCKCSRYTSLRTYVKGKLQNSYAGVSPISDLIRKKESKSTCKYIPLRLEFLDDKKTYYGDYLHGPGGERQEGLRLSKVLDNWLISKY